ncbi:DUF805 domain-containing protein [Salmonella enterica]|uniref:DUF805 domain-containing protein n=1 Tax=Salmonella enterica TaxID=28901 RepID=UPI0012D500E5|nr:DUF805 domain-containing protein [Salmonella enterica]EBQ9005070.1 DUF805 domain-containing protein [Salmonella enterica subsp. enterica serovar Blockley]ECU7995137.1 DUF805 domain-containing protein [Salmonella enterica subsp. enterica serovar Toucra]ECW2124481.1 DUF805 domain-containing protein [Salmonella enterica]
MQWYLQVLKKYAVFSGRARRKEYWMFTLINCIITVVLGCIDVWLNQGFPVITIIYALGMLLPNWGVVIRRLHDTDRSGFWVLIPLFPLIGPFILLVFMFLDGTSGYNRYGADPKGRLNKIIQ